MKNAWVLVYEKTGDLYIDCTNDMKGGLEDHAMSGRIWHDRTLAEAGCADANSTFDADGPIAIVEVLWFTQNVEEVKA